MNFLWANNQPRCTRNPCIPTGCLRSGNYTFMIMSKRDVSRQIAAAQRSGRRVVASKSIRRPGNNHDFSTPVFEIGHDSALSSASIRYRVESTYLCAGRWNGIRIASLNEPPITIMQIFLINGDPSAAACLKSETVSCRFRLDFNYLASLDLLSANDPSVEKEREKIDRVDPLSDLSAISRAFSRWISRLWTNVIDNWGVIVRRVTRKGAIISSRRNFGGRENWLGREEFATPTRRGERRAVPVSLRETWVRPEIR